MAITAYENLLNANPAWALMEGSLHFEKESAVFKALHKITTRLVQLGIPHAIVDGMAMFLHGYRRFTEDVVILVTREDLARIHQELEGRGYLALFEGSKHLRDEELGVRIDFLTTGDYPGDGKPKPIAFPDPRDVVDLKEGIQCLNLVTLIQLKLTLGQSPGRRKDLGDVQELIRHFQLPADFASELDPSVRGGFQELWQELQASSA